MPVIDTTEVSKAPPRRRERSALLLSSAAFFLVLCSYYIIRPVRDQLSGATGSTALPLFYSGVFVAMLALTPFFGYLVSRFPRRRLIAICYSFFIICLLLFVPAFMVQDQIGAKRLGIIFFTWVSIFNLFVVSLFWSLMADLFDNDQSNRLFPLIGIGGTLGALVGPLLTTALVGTIGVAPLLVVSAVVLSLSMVILLYLSLRSGAGAAPAEPIGGSILAGVKQAFTQPFIRLMAILMLLSDGIGTVAYALLADYTKDHIVGAVARTLMIAEAGNVLLFILLAVFAVHTLPLPWFDWSNAALISVGIPVIALVMVGTRGLAYGVIVPASNTLYTRAAREARYKGKNFVDTAVWRFGDVLVTTSLSSLKAIGAGIPLLATISATAAVAAGIVGWRAGHSPDLEPPRSKPTP